MRGLRLPDVSMVPDSGMGASLRRRRKWAVGLMALYVLAGALLGGVAFWATVHLVRRAW